RAGGGVSAAAGLRPVPAGALADGGDRAVAARGPVRPARRGGAAAAAGRAGRPALARRPPARLRPALVRGEPRALPARPATPAGPAGACPVSRPPGPGRTRLVRHREVAFPVPAIRREILTAVPADAEGRPPLLFVP